MTAEMRLDPARTAVINVDMQCCFVEGTPLASPEGTAVLERINRLLDECRRLGMTIVHTRASVLPDGSDTGPVATALVPDFIRALYTIGSPTWELHSDLSVADADIVLDKPRYGAFHGTGLEAVLRDRGIDSVVVTGIATNMCCEATAREAAVRDFFVYFVRDAMGTMEMNGVSADDLTRATCATLAMTMARVVTISELLSLAGVGVTEDRAAAGT